MKSTEKKLTERETNPFPYTNSNKRYHTLDYHLKEKFGCKVFKISLNAGFTCPNKDGSRGVGGCSYCSKMGSGDFAGDVELSIDGQFEQIKETMHKKWSEGKYIAYFQAYTNTYGPTDILEKLYRQALSQQDVVGLFISTRPDCISEETLELLEQLSKETYLVVELGLQTIHEKTAQKINRCHSFGEYLEAVERLHSKGINVCTHTILGLPYETKEMMLETVKAIAPLKLHSMKIHLLHILDGTKIAQEYAEEGFTLPSKEEYIDIVCDCLELLPKETIIQRLTGDGGKQDLIAPLWTLKKTIVLNDIDKELLRRNSYQGKNFVE